jgi:arsenite methyltransferase
MTPTMIERAKRAALKVGLWETVEIRRGMSENLPLENGSVDVVISNGVLNLSSDKLRSYGEIYRVLKPGGRLYLADVVVQRELSLAMRSDVDLWAARIGGSLPEAELYQITAQIGFVDGAIVERFDCYAETTAKDNLSKDLYVMGVNFFARKAGPDLTPRSELTI